MVFSAQDFKDEAQINRQGIEVSIQLFYRLYSSVTVSILKDIGQDSTGVVQLMIQRHSLEFDQLHWYIACYLHTYHR